MEGDSHQREVLPEESSSQISRIVSASLSQETSIRKKKRVATEDNKVEEEETAKSVVSEASTRRGEYLDYFEKVQEDQEANGLLFADRTPKFSIEHIHAATTGNPAQIPTVDDLNSSPRAIPPPDKGEDEP